ncbi:hypothetical protein Tco_0800228 [Tanacetum coccineum]|uniref:Reverse transcriptase Ty1/copia-type domain-containing protein n=1 Tax=Tanacetum coccineum TaxID=301880 RepID=A0ABQ4ZTI6_9ASTR
MKDLGEAAYILGIKIIHDRSKRLISLSQSAYLKKILMKFRMENSKTGYTPMMEKPDYRKSQGAKTPTEVQRMQRVPYASAIDMVLMYGDKPEDELKVSCYADASFQTDKDDTKSQTGYVFILNGGVVDWKSAKQSTTAMSSKEAEYAAGAEASMEVVWMRKFIDRLGGVMPSNKRPIYFQRKYHYIREVIQEREIILKKVHTDDNIADPFTKPMPFSKHFEHAMAIGVVPASSLMPKEKGNKDWAFRLAFPTRFTRLLGLTTAQYQREKLASIPCNTEESPISAIEIRNAVWSCGENKSPGPDGFTFDFFRKFWDVLGNDFSLAVLVVEAGFYKGISFNGSTNISHLFYADDVVFIGEWSRENLSRVMHALHCFSLASGLKINVHKSHLLGVDIPKDTVEAVASVVGCSSMSTPFKTMGLWL